MSAKRRLPRAVLAAAGLDTALVLLFATLGRQSHALEHGVVWVFVTAWPFLVALTAGWMLTRLWRNPAGLKGASVLWAITVAGGQLLRYAAGAGNLSLAFVLVSAAVLAVLLLGWRLLFAGWRTLRSRRHN